MANKDAAFGFKPVRHLSGGEIRTEEYKIASGYAENIFTGSIVHALAAGGIEAAAPADVQNVGTFAGCFYDDPTTSKPTYSALWPTGTAADAVAYVYADPFIVYEAQHDGTGTSAMNFSGFDFIGVAGNAKTGTSTSELDTTSSGTSGNFKQIGISKDPDNSDEATDNANAYVVFNADEHVYNLTTAI